MKTIKRALTIKQPWADLIVAGVKDVENRTWPVPSTLDRGRRYPSRRPRWLGTGQPWPCSECEREVDIEDPHNCGTFPFTIAIHAGLSWDEGAYGGWLLRPSNMDGRPELWPPGTHDGVQGHQDMCHRMARPVLGTFVGTVDVTGCHPAEDCQTAKRDPWHHGSTYMERCSRWANPDAHHWTLANAVRFDTPIPARGRQRLWTLTDDQSAQLQPVTEAVSA